MQIGVLLSDQRMELGITTQSHAALPIIMLRVADDVWSCDCWLADYLCNLIGAAV